MVEYSIYVASKQTKVIVARILDLLFADDYALNSTSNGEKQDGVDNFSSACDNFGLTARMVRLK